MLDRKISDLSNDVLAAINNTIMYGDFDYPEKVKDKVLTLAEKMLHKFPDNFTGSKIDQKITGLLNQFTVLTLHYDHEDCSTCYFEPIYLYQEPVLKSVLYIHFVMFYHGLSSYIKSMGVSYNNCWKQYGSIAHAVATINAIMAVKEMLDKNRVESQEDEAEFINLTVNREYLLVTFLLSSLRGYLLLRELYTMQILGSI